MLHMKNTTALKVPGRSLNRELVEPGSRLTSLIGREGVQYFLDSMAVAWQTIQILKRNLAI